MTVAWRLPSRSTLPAMAVRMDDFPAEGRQPSAQLPPLATAVPRRKGMWIWDRGAWVPLTPPATGVQGWLEWRPWGLQTRDLLLLPAAADQRHCWMRVQARQTSSLRPLPAVADQRRGWMQVQWQQILSLRLPRVSAVQRRTKRVQPWGRQVWGVLPPPPVCCQQWILRQAVSHCSCWLEGAAPQQRLAPGSDGLQTQQQEPGATVLRRRRQRRWWRQHEVQLHSQLRCQASPCCRQLPAGHWARCYA